MNEPRRFCTCPYYILYYGDRRRTVGNCQRLDRECESHVLTKRSCFSRSNAEAVIAKRCFHSVPNTGSCVLYSLKVREVSNETGQWPESKQVVQKKCGQWVMSAAQVAVSILSMWVGKEW
jgi:hypothetical protein